MDSTEKFKVVKGNLLDMADSGDFDIIVHGANCFHKMASGIAGQIAKRYPQAVKADCDTSYGSRNKLGHYSEATSIDSVGKEFSILNAYTQFTYSRSRDVFDYGAFETFLNRLCARVVSKYLRNQKATGIASPIRIGFPKIGCGLAGGDEKRIMAMLEEFAVDLGNYGNVTVVEFSP